MKVKLHSNDKRAAEATDATIKGLPGSAYLMRNADGEIAFDDDGLATAENCSDFTAFALKAQGYISDIPLLS